MVVVVEGEGELGAVGAHAKGRGLDSWHVHMIGTKVSVGRTVGG